MPSWNMAFMNFVDCALTLSIKVWVEIHFFFNENLRLMDFHIQVIEMFVWESVNQQSEPLFRQYMFTFSSCSMFVLNLYMCAQHVWLANFFHPFQQDILLFLTEKICSKCILLSHYLVWQKIEIICNP